MYAYTGTPTPARPTLAALTASRQRAPDGRPEFVHHAEVQVSKPRRRIDHARERQKGAGEWDYRGSGRFLRILVTCCAFQGAEHRGSAPTDCTPRSLL